MNKYLFALSVLLLPFLVEAQKKKKILFYELDVHDGLFFQPNTIDPYTGLAYEEFEKGKKKAHIPIKNGKINGKVKGWEMNGEKVYEAEYEMGTMVGTEKQWYATGAKKLTISYVDGKPDGVCTEWFKNGSKKSEGYYTRGKEDGDHHWWYSTGDKDQLVPYNMGVVNGKVINWHRNGNLKLEKEYINGVEEGITAEYFDSGLPKSRAEFKNDQPHGETKMWSRKGLLLGIQTFDKGELVKDINYRSGSVRLSDGYLQVFNEKESFFTVALKGEEVRPLKSIDIVYIVDEMFLQLFNYSTSLFIDTLNTTQSEKETLEQFIEKEAALIREKTEYDIQVQTKWLKTKGGKDALYWYFKSPSSEDEVQEPRTVQEEHYVSLICNKQILNCYGIVTNSDKRENVIAMLENLINNVEIKPKRIDINEISF
ncbi:MAG: toxin-antitoxin system YwqK family antitoxin [Saprospiraceae bacterium]